MCKPSRRAGELHGAAELRPGAAKFDNTIPRVPSAPFTPRPPWPSNLRRPHTHSNMKATPSRWWGRRNCGRAEGEGRQVPSGCAIRELSRGSSSAGLAAPTKGMSPRHVARRAAALIVRLRRPLCSQSPARAYLCQHVIHPYRLALLPGRRLPQHQRLHPWGQHNCWLRRCRGCCGCGSQGLLQCGQRLLGRHLRQRCGVGVLAGIVVYQCRSALAGMWSVHWLACGVSLQDGAMSISTTGQVLRTTHGRQQEVCSRIMKLHAAHTAGAQRANLTRLAPYDQC